MNRGAYQGYKGLFIPPHLGGFDASKDKYVITLDSSQPDGLAVTQNLDLGGVGAVVNAADIGISGLPGATTGTRLAGGTVSGPPLTGTWIAGDIVPDLTGAIWVCTTGGIGTAAVWTNSAQLALPNRVLAYGHSYLTSVGNTAPDRGIGTMLEGVLHGRVDNEGHPGAQLAMDETGVVGQGAGGIAAILQDPQLIPARTAAPYVPNGQMGLLVYGINDLGFQHFIAGHTTIFAEALRTAISRYSIARLFEDTDAAIAYGGGTWPTAIVATKSNSGGGYHPIPGNGATETFTIPADFEGGAIAFGFVDYPNSDGVMTFSGTASACAAQAVSAVATLGAFISVTVPSVANFYVGQTINVTGITGFATNNPNGVVVVTNVLPLTNQISYTALATPTGGYTSGGSVSPAVSFVGKAANQGGAGAQRSSNNCIVARLNCVAADAGKTIIATASGMGAALSPPGNAGTIVTGGTPGLTTYGYKWVWVNQNGDTIPSVEKTITTGNATLTASNYNTIPGPGAFPAGVVAARLIRTTGGVNNGGQGLVTTLISNINWNDIGPVGAYTAAVVNPMTGGAAVDYVQMESDNPTSLVGVTNIVRPLLGGYTSYPSSGSMAIVSGGGVGSSVITVTAVGGNVVAGSVIQLTGGVAESVKVLSVTTTTITLTANIANASHTALSYGFANDADVAAYNVAIQGVVAEFNLPGIPPTVFYADIDSLIAGNPAHMFSDGLHLNDRGSSLLISKLYAAIVQAMALQPLTAVASFVRGVRSPENHGIPPVLTGNVTVNSTTWTKCVTLNAENVAIILQASPGDDIKIDVSFIWGVEGFLGEADVCTLNSGGAINKTMSHLYPDANSAGCGGLYAPASVYLPVAATGIITLDASDIVAGLVYLFLIARITAAGARTLFTANPAITFVAANTGRKSSFYGY